MASKVSDSGGGRGDREAWQSRKAKLQQVRRERTTGIINTLLKGKDAFPIPKRLN